MGVDSRVLPIPRTLPPHPPWRNDVVQLLNGTCGAGVDTTSPVVNPKLWHIHQHADIYYFSVIDIHGSQVNVTSCGGNTIAEDYKVIDKFTIYRGHREEFGFYGGPESDQHEFSDGLTCIRH